MSAPNPGFLPGTPLAPRDTVRLKTGGPAMIVMALFPNSDLPKTAQCEWFDKHDCARKKLFFVADLVRV